MRDILKEIKDFTNTVVAPALAEHNGSVEILEYEPVDRVVKLRYNNACAGCPSSNLQTHQTILALLKAEFGDEVADLERI